MSLKCSIVTLCFSLLYSFVLFSSVADSSKLQNKFDRKGMRHGRWNFYYDDANTKISMNGRFRHGREKGMWKYYTIGGEIYKEEKYKRFRSMIITVYYHKNGKISNEGKAKIADEKDGLHYYWNGDWKYYSEEGTHIKTIIYKNGKVIKEIKY